MGNGSYNHNCITFYELVSKLYVGTKKIVLHLDLGQ